MNRERDIERVLDAWLEPGPTVMPDRLFDGVLDRIERQPQRRLARLQLRFTPMRPITILAAAAAIAVAVGAGVILLGRPATPDVAAPTAAPSVAPAPTAAPTPTPASALPHELRYRWIGTPRVIDGVSSLAGLPLLWMAEPLVSLNHNLGGRFLESEPMLGGQGTFPPDAAGTLDGRVTFVLRSGLIGGCRAGDVGAYVWRLSADRMTLTLTAERDACAVRAEAFSGSWTRSACRNDADTCLGQVTAGTHVSSFLDVRSAPGAVRRVGAHGQLRYRTTDASWANMDDWPDLYTLVSADEYGGPVGDPDRDDLWHGIYVRPRPAAATGGDTCSTKPAPGVGTSAAELAAAIAANPALVVSEPVDVPVGARTGIAIDVALRDDWAGICRVLAGPVPTVPLLVEQAGGSDRWDWGIVRGELQRLVFVDLEGGRTVVIAIDTNQTPLQSRFDDLVARAMPLIATFEFPAPE